MRWITALVLTAVFLALVPASCSAQFIPGDWDWRDAGGKNLVSGVRNHQSCNASYIFAPVAVVESRQMIALERATGVIREFDYSEQYILSCAFGYFGYFDCTGGYAKDTFTFFEDIGVPEEACYEYTGAEESCPSNCPDTGMPIVRRQIPGPITEWQPFPEVGDVVREVFYNGPVVATMDVYQDFYNYSSGIYRHVTGSQTGAIAVTIVGYGIDLSTSYWICKNNWGTSWGENGFFKIARDGSDNCNFMEWVWFAEVGVPSTAAPTAPVVGHRLRNHPNPFNPRTTISFGTAEPGLVTLRIYDVAGRLVRTLVDEFRDASALHEVIWDGRDDEGRAVPSGAYFSRLIAPECESSDKLALIR